MWELQIQRGANTEYEHFSLKQTGTAITGTYLTQDKKKYPLAGSNRRTYGSRRGLALTDPKERVPFTAAYRPKEEWSDNLNAQPGGLGSPSGTGYPPR